MNIQTKNKAKELYEKIKDYDLSKVIQRHRKVANISLEEAENRANELKKWLVLSKSNNEKKYQITGNIDKIWHTFLVFTKEYHDFCGELGGFIHHIPTDTDLLRRAKNNPDLLEQLNERFNQDYGNVLSDYEIVFETLPPSGIWPNVINPFGRTYDPGSNTGGGCSDNTCGCGNSGNLPH